MASCKLTEDYCNNIIKVFSEEETMETLVIKGRSYKRFIIHENSPIIDKYQWLWNDIEDIVKCNLGNNHYLTIWIIVLKYDKGDYFEKHIDRPKQDDNRYLSGGIELSDKSDFEGGQFVVKNIPILFEKGKLLTHKVTDSHEITKLKKGTRWSLHFGINKQKQIL